MKTVQKLPIPLSASSESWLKGQAPVSAGYQRVPVNKPPNPKWNQFCCACTIAGRPKLVKAPISPKVQQTSRRRLIRVVKGGSSCQIGQLSVLCAGRKIIIQNGTTRLGSRLSVQNALYLPRIEWSRSRVQGVVYDKVGQSLTRLGSRFSLRNAGSSHG
jgi:hypothetical protein